ncbi:hypothetical protein K7X08_005677 [Anisodus acutangulus]|uniref:Uncharacterized protein n=1 Tax=Anisodus acutangulus TaxID=402998 RepID=A0A9Q1R748_9SOLA|nr:hypothetical protein K7X08_005677 [Anisodus acutangulus]
MVMLRNNSRRAVSSKQSHMADNMSLPSPIQNNTNNNPISSFLASPRFFNGMLTRSLSDIDSEISPKSILDCKQMFNLGNPFGYDRNNSNSITYIDKKESTFEEERRNLNGSPVHKVFRISRVRGRVAQKKCNVHNLS